MELGGREERLVKERLLGGSGSKRRIFMGL